MYYLFLFGKILAKVLPRRFAYAIAEIIALLWYFIAEKDRGAVESNLAPLIIDEHARKKCAPKVFINFALYLVDFFRYDRLNKHFIEKFVRITEIEHFKNAQAQNKGVIILSAHLGNYELGAAIVSLLGNRLSAVILPHKDKRINELFDCQRYQAGINIIAADTGAKNCYRELKRGGVVALLADRDFFKNYFDIVIAGKTARIPRGPAFFALKTGASVIPVFLVRENKYYFRLIFDQPIEITAQDDEYALTKKYAAVIEKYLRLYPEQWYLFEKYWQECDKKI